VAALIGIFAGLQTSSAGTFTVLTQSAFDAKTTGQATTGFNSVTGLDFGDPSCPGSGACFAGFNPLTVNGITFSTTSGDHVNVNSANYYGATDLPVQYIVNSETHFVTITLPTAVTAFGLNYGTLFSPSSANFVLSNGFSTTIDPTLGDLHTQFLGFLSSTAFNQITFTVPDTASFVVENVTTAVTPIPATLPLFAAGLGSMGLLAWRRRRSPAA
jgi:hypothetical protein